MPGSGATNRTTKAQAIAATTAPPITAAMSGLDASLFAGDRLQQQLSRDALAAAGEFVRGVDLDLGLFSPGS